MSTARFPKKRQVQRLQDEDEEEWDPYVEDHTVCDEEGDGGSGNENGEADGGSGNINGEADSAGRTRGANKGTNGGVDGIGKIFLQWAKKRFITVTASRDISANIKSYLGGPYSTFSRSKKSGKVPEQTEELLWGGFKNRYTWPAEMQREVRQIWLSSSKTLIRQIFRDARKDARAESGSNDMADWKGHGPPWLAAEHWDELVKRWNTLDWLKLSKSGQKNRLTQKCGTITKHTGGSITFVAHEARMTKELGRSPTTAEFFKRIHKRKRGVGDFVDNKSKLVCETYEHSMEEKHGADVSSQPVIDIDLWCEVSQGPNKSGQLYGLGTSLSVLQPESIPPPRDDLGSDLTLKEACEKIDELQRDKEAMRQEIEEVKREEDRKRKEFEQQMEEQMEERRVQEERERIAFQKMIMKKINGA